MTASSQHMHADVPARYVDERVPRYTSYPTAPHFSAAITRETYAGWLSALPAGVRGSLYVHVPFCRSMCWYCGCHTTITRRDTPILDYLAALRREIELVADRVGDLHVRHVHFGGGTPTVMPPNSFLKLVALLRSRFSFATETEVAVEIDPRNLTGAMVSALGAAGVTRASLGVQSLDPTVQRAVNRVQDLEAIARASEDLRTAGIGGINFDLIYGLPHQTVDSCTETVRQCLKLLPERFAVFGYAHVPGFKKHQRKIDEGTLPDGRERLVQAGAIARALTEAGYQPIGIDHFALPDDPMARAQREGTLHRNFQGYTTDTGDVLIGFGASAIGRLAQGYVQNEVAVGRYAARILQGELPTIRGHELTPDDLLRADIIERLMCDFRVDLEAVCRRHDATPETALETATGLHTLMADGLVRRDGSVISMASDMQFLVRAVASAFDAYGASGRTFSRAV